MSIRESQIIKGLAVLMLLWYHLFINEEDANNCYNLFYIADIPLSKIIAKACNPVEIFLILSGYGLYCVYLKGNDNNHYRRIIRLYIHYWVVLILFFPLIFFFSSNELDLQPASIVKNLTSLRTTWNKPCWFLLPFSIVSISYPLIFRFLDRFKTILTATIALILSILQSILFFGFTPFVFSHTIIFLINNILSFLFPFILGAIMKKENLLNAIPLKIQSLKAPSIYSGILLFMLFCTKCCLPSTFLTFSLYPFLFVVFFYLAKRPTWIDNTLLFFGKHSMNIWLIHGMIYIYFNKLLYSFGHPILIWIALTILSLVASFCVDMIAKKIK